MITLAFIDVRREYPTSYFSTAIFFLLFAIIALCLNTEPEIPSANIKTHVVAYAMAAEQTQEDAETAYYVLTPDMLLTDGEVHELPEETQVACEPEMKTLQITLSDGSIHNYEVNSDFPFTVDDITNVARTVYGEARGLCKNEQAAVIWCILNRLDNQDSFKSHDTIYNVLTKGGFYGFRSSSKVTQEIVDLTLDVLDRYLKEKDGETVSRELPQGYYYFMGDGKHNYFTQQYHKGSLWFAKKYGWHPYSE